MPQQFGQFLPESKYQDFIAIPRTTPNPLWKKPVLKRDGIIPYRTGVCGELVGAYDLNADTN